MIGRGGIFVRALEHCATVLDRHKETDDAAFGYIVGPEGTLLELFQPAAST